MMEYVEKAPEKPEDFARFANDLLNTPNEENIERFYNCCRSVPRLERQGEHGVTFY
jgi:hypothetical protein